MQTISKNDCNQYEPLSHYSSSLYFISVITTNSLISCFIYCKEAK